MGLRRAPRRSPPQRSRSRSGEPARTRWWRGLGLKTAVIAAVVPLAVGAVWAQGGVWLQAWFRPAPSASASPPDAHPGDPGPGSSTSPPSSHDTAPPSSPPSSHDTAPPSSPPSSTSPSSHDTTPGGARVRRSGTLVMADYTAYDLDSTAANWNPTKGDWGPTRDVGYASWRPDASNDALVSRDDPKFAAALSGTGPWQRADCVRARYGDPSARPVGDRLLEGWGICVVTSAGRYALLVVTGSDERQLRVQVTVWD